MAKVILTFQEVVTKTLEISDRDMKECLVDELDYTKKELPKDIQKLAELYISEEGFLYDYGYYTEDELDGARLISCTVKK